MRFKEIEYVNQKDGTRKRHPVKSVKVLAVVGTGDDSGYPDWHTGICVCVALPHPEGKEKEHDEDLTNEMWGTGENVPFTVWLIGEGDINIPLNVSEGNGWSKRHESSCVFGYMAPTFFEE